MDWICGSVNFCIHSQLEQIRLREARGLASLNRSPRESIVVLSSSINLPRVKYQCEGYEKYVA